MIGRQPHDLVFGQYGVDAPAFDVYRDTAGPCVSCTPYSCHRDNFAGDSRLTGPEDRTMSDSYEFATHMWGMPPGPGGCIDASTFFRDFLETRDEVSDSMFSLGTDTDASTAREHALLGTIRALLLALLFVGMVGMGSELVLLGHYEDTVQLLPLLLLVAGLVVVLWQAVRPGAASVRVLRFVMGLFVASGLIGVGYHYTGNAEFERELYPSMETITLFREALSGATPTLAPGSMMLLGFMGLIYAHRHPRLSRHGIGVERPIHQEVRS